MATKSKRPCNKILPKKLIKPQQKQENTTLSSNVSKNSMQTASGLDPEAEDQFELELCWCIQQLQAGLTKVKLEDKQIFNLTKTLNVLKSSNASLIKKRQVMRNTFGDYRTKMIEDEKKFGKTSTLVKYIPCNTNKLEKKSSFLKKAQFLKNAAKENEDKPLMKNVIINPNVSNEPFKFNFLCKEP